MRIQARALAVFIAFAAGTPAPALAQTQIADLGVVSLEVRGDPGRPGGQLAVTARIGRFDRGPPDSVIAVLRFQTPSEPRPFAERRVALAPGERAAVTVPWTARAGRQVVSVSIAVGTNQVVDRGTRAHNMTTRDVVIFARGRRDAPREEPPTEVGARPLAAASAAPATITATVLAMTSAPATLVAASGLSTASAPPALIATGALAIASAPVAALATSALGMTSAPVVALATGALSLSSAPAITIAAPALTGVSAPALAVETVPLGAESRTPPEQPSDQPPNQPSDQPTGDQPARQP
jgi:hypothetical protein